jgi:hypothetical protein
VGFSWLGVAGYGTGLAFTCPTDCIPTTNVKIVARMIVVAKIFFGI